MLLWSHLYPFLNLKTIVCMLRFDPILATLRKSSDYLFMLLGHKLFDMIIKLWALRFFVVDFPLDCSINGFRSISSKG